MSEHSSSRDWSHIIWATLGRRPLLTAPVAAKLSEFLYRYAQEKGIYMKINYVNADHVHALVDVPTNMCVEEMMQLFKGASSHWINQNDFLKVKFSWGRGYGNFSVSESLIGKACGYIANQADHHRKKTFSDEVGAFAKLHGLEWRADPSSH